MKTCPYCVEEIQDAALRCKHCGADLISRQFRWLAERYSKLSPAERLRETRSLSAEEGAQFKRVWQTLEAGMPTDEIPAGHPSTHPGARLGAVPTIAWVVALLGAVAGGLDYLVSLPAAESAPQQAAGAAMAVASAVIPYCLARAVTILSRIRVPSRGV